MATLYNERHLVYDYSHYIVKMKLLTTCASKPTERLVGAWLELAAVPVALISITIAIC